MSQTATPPAVAGRFRHRPGPRLLAGLTLCAGLGLSLGLWHNARGVAQQRAQADFQADVRDLVNRLARQMESYTAALQGVQGLYAASDFVEREEFRAYVTAQQSGNQFPGVQVLGFIRQVEGTARGAHIALVRKEGFAQYGVFPPGERPQYAPVVYLEPFSGINLRAFGFDVASEPVRRAALERARDSGRATLTGKVRLLQDAPGPERPGFLLLLPVYHNHQPHDSAVQRRAALQGWVYTPFHLDELMAGLEQEHAAALDVQIYDGDGVAPQALIFDSLRGASGAAPAGGIGGTGSAAGAAGNAAVPAPGLASVQKFSVGGRRWILHIAARPGAEHGAGPRKLFLAGLSLSALLTLLTWLLARSRSQAESALRDAHRLAGQLNDGQARLLALAETAQGSQAMLRSILDSTMDGVLVDQADGTVIVVNRRFRELWQVPEQAEWQHQAGALFAHIAQQLMAAAVPPPTPLPPPLALPPPAGAGAGNADPAPGRSVLRLADGRVIEQFVRALQLGSGAARLWSFRDITERSQVEHRERTRRHMLELLARGAPLPAILETVALGIEADNEDMLCSILLLDERGTHLLTGAAPSLPAFFTAAIHNQAIGNGRGACGTAAAIGSRVVCEDIRSHPFWREFRDLAAQAGLGACWSEPIRGSSGQILGTFAIYHRRPQRPSAAHVALIEEASHLAGIAIEQAQAALALRAGEARFRSLYDHAPVALWELDWSALRAALDELELADPEALAGYLRANPSQVRRLAALVRIVDANAAAQEQAGLAAAVLADGDGGKDLGALSLAQIFDEAGMASFALALTALANGAHFFACESTFRRLDGVARQNAVTLLVMPGHAHSLDFVIVSTLDITERKRLDRELLVLASTDFLTGLPNRREFMARLDGEHARLRRDLGGCAAVLMLDIDHFKNVNDHHGHAVGDAVLRHCAALMGEQQRKVDSLGRLGGEEFALLLPGAELAAAGVFAERLRQRVASTPLHLDGKVISVTVSIGIAALSGAEVDYDAALIRADTALYRAKRSGRNRIEYALPARLPDPARS